MGRPHIANMRRMLDPIVYKVAVCLRLLTAFYYRVKAAHPKEGCQSLIDESVHALYVRCLDAKVLSGMSVCLLCRRCGGSLPQWGSADWLNRMKKACPSLFVHWQVFGNAV
jgi:hypothetical protein